MSDNEENQMEQLITPEEVAATAPDEADVPDAAPGSGLFDPPPPGGDMFPGPLDDQEALEDAYDIQPAADPDDDDEPEEDVQPNAQTAFLVIVDATGAAFATSDLAKINEILPARDATIVDMRRACQEVVHDVNAMQISQQTVGLMQQSAQEMAEAKRNAQIAAKLQSKGIQVPGRGARR